MSRCVALSKNLERCSGHAERGSIFCRQHRWWWVITLFGAIVTISTIGANIVTIRAGFTDVFGTLKCPPKVGQTLHTTIGTKVWSQPDVFQGTTIKVFQEKADVFVLDGPIIGTIRSDNPSVTGNWWKISLERGQESIGWIWEGRFDECQPK